MPWSCPLCSFARLSSSHSEPQIGAVCTERPPGLQDAGGHTLSSGVEGTRLQITDLVSSHLYFAPCTGSFALSFPLPFLFFFPLPPFHHFPSEAFPSGRGRAGLTPRLSPAPAALWREGAPSSPGHQRRRSEERDRRRRPRAQGHHGTSSLSDPSAAAVRPARVPAPAGPVCPLLPPQTARPWSRAPRCRAPRIMRW